MNLYGIIVVYNKNIEESISYQFVKRHKEINLYVIDNSDLPNQNKDIVINDGFHYINMEGNKGLSKAYNKGIDEITKDNPSMEGLLIILDDDTELNEDYLQEVRKCHGDISLPIVKDNNSIIISPCTNVNGVYMPLTEATKGKNISAINSGMVIQLNIFKEYRYDENLFLDYVDHKFMKDMNNKNIQVMQSVLNQSFSGSDDSNMQGSINRLRIFKKDSKYFYKNDYLKYLIVVGKRKLKLTVMFKNPVFLFK